MSWTILLVAHGTVDDLRDMPQFLLEIRRGRPVEAAFLDVMCSKYRHVGGSPLLRHTQEQAARLSESLALPVRVAMRLWDPRVSDVCEDLGGQDRVCLVPLAPFSVAVYEEAAQRELRSLPDPPTLVAVEPWGSHPALLAALASETQRYLKKKPTRELVILTAHSLPRAVIERGDRYQHEFEACAREVSERLGVPTQLAYQSQGEGGGEWLGPTLLSTLRQARDAGIQRVVVSPIGFLSEHVETLYDLDVEARLQAQALELEFARVPALGSHPGLIEALSDTVRATLARAEKLSDSSEVDTAPARPKLSP